MAEKSKTVKLRQKVSVFIDSQIVTFQAGEHKVDAEVAEILSKTKAAE